MVDKPLTATDVKRLIDARLPSPANGKAITFIFWAGQTLLVTLCTAGILHEVRISKIEDNRFTDRDSIELERRLLAQLPPRWLREDISEIKAVLKALETRLRAIENGNR